MNGSARTPPDLRRCRDLGREQGLAAGLAAALAGLDPLREAPAGVAVLPAAALPGGVGVLPHPVAGLEGLVLVRIPSNGSLPAHPRGLAGARASALAAVRIGVLDRLLDLAVERLQNRRFAGVALIDQQLVAGAVADVAVEIELATAGMGLDATPEVAWAGHERLTEAGWSVARFFGAEGFTTDHPARSLHMSALVADMWVARPTAVAGKE